MAMNGGAEYLGAVTAALEPLAEMISKYVFLPFTDYMIALC